MLRAFCFPMQDPDSVDFLKPHEETPSLQAEPTRTRPAKRRFSVRTKLVLFGIAILATGGFLLSSGITSTTPQEPTENLSFLASLKRLVVSGDKEVHRTR